MAKTFLFEHAAGDIVHTEMVNKLQRTLALDVVGRSLKGAPAPDKKLGNSSYGWLNTYANRFYLNNRRLQQSDLKAGRYDILDGKTRSESSYPIYVVPSGSGLTGSLSIVGNQLVYKVAGEIFTATSDIQITGLTAAPSSNNTATFNDVYQGGGQFTKYWGDIGSGQESWTIASAGSAITALVGRIAVFSISDGSNTEYVEALVESSTSLKEVRRGLFYNSAAVPFNAVSITGTPTITLMQAHWIFLNSDGLTATVTTRNPVNSPSAPGSPSTGDFWYDMTTKLWKRYNGSSFVDYESTYIGMFVCDSTNCVAARSKNLFFSIDNIFSDIVLINSGTTIIGKHFNRQTQVGPYIHYQPLSRITWNPSTDFAPTPYTIATSLTGSNNVFFLYYSEIGEPLISDIIPIWDPYTRLHYHPQQLWLCIGWSQQDHSGSVGLTTKLKSLVSLPNRSGVRFANGEYGRNESAVNVNLTSTFHDIGPNPNVNSSAVHNERTWKQATLADEMYFCTPGYYKFLLTGMMSCLDTSGGSPTGINTTRLFNDTNSAASNSPNMVWYDVGFGFSGVGAWYSGHGWHKVLSIQHADAVHVIEANTTNTANSTSNNLGQILIDKLGGGRGI